MDVYIITKDSSSMLGGKSNLMLVVYFVYYIKTKCLHFFIPHTQFPALLIDSTV